MKKVAKAILIALGVILVVGAAAILGVNVYVQSAAMHARIEQGLGKGLRMPVKIGGLSFMPWHGLRISTITSNDPEATANGSVLEISSISVRPRLWRLLHHDVVIKMLSVDGVKMAWTQTPAGKWEAPAPIQAAPATPGQPAPAPPATAQETPPAAENPAAQPQPAQPKQTTPSVTVENARMRNAAFTFYNRSHKPVVALTGVFAQVFSPTDQLVDGVAAVKRVAVQEAFYIDAWKGLFKYTPEELTVYDTECSVGGGTATGTANVKTAEENSPFSLDMEFSGVNLDRLLSDARVAGIQANGALSGFLRLQGNFHDSNATTGAGRIVLPNGSLSQSDLFENLNVTFRTDRFRGLAIKDTHADFHIDGGKVFLDDLAVNSPGIMSLTGKGVALIATGDVYIRCRLAFDPNTVRQLPSIVMENFDLDPTTGTRFVDFDVMGTVNHLRSNLSNTIGDRLKRSAKDLWNKVLGGGKKSALPPPAPPAPEAPAQTQPAVPAQPMAPAP